MGNATAGKLPYDIGDRVDAFDGKSRWHLHHGTNKATKEPVSIFRYEKTKGGDANAEVAENYFKNAKKLRHPHVLGFLDGVNLDGEICIVTPPVMPLAEWLAAQRAAASPALDGAIAWGL